MSLYFMAFAWQGGMLYPAQMAQPAPVKATSVLPTAALSQTVPQEVHLKFFTSPCLGCYHIEKTISHRKNSYSLHAAELFVFLICYEIPP